MNAGRFEASSPIIVVSILAVFLVFLSCAFQSTREPESFISSINISVDEIQREKVPFTIRNSTDANAEWRWEIIDSENGDIVETSTQQHPTFQLAQGQYDVRLFATSKNILLRHYRRHITVLPKIFTEAEADEVIDLSAVTDPTFVKNFGDQKRPGYKIMMKGRYTGRVVFTGLKGTRRKPVHIINKGRVEITAGNDASPYAWQFSDNNQYILLDGKADSTVTYGFSVTGHPTKSGQVLFVAGVFSRGFEICGLHLQGHQGKTQGAAAIQVQPSYTKECNADNWNFEYLSVHHSKIENASSEGMYIGYFTDEARDTGFAPYRMGVVHIYSDTILNSGWDAIQIASADEFEVHNNYIDGAARSGKRSHSSFLAWNSGNKTGWCYRNTFMNCAHGASVIFGESGKDAFIYSNLFIEGDYPSNITTPAFFFSKVNNTSQNVGLYIFHNTVSTSKISAKVDYKNEKSTTGIPVLYAANAILQNRLNLKTFPEIAMGSKLQDSVSWTIKNIWRMKDQEKELLWDSAYRPKEGSPLLNFGFDIRAHISKLKGGFYDRDGYPLRHDSTGYTAGCFSAHQVSSEQQNDPNGIH
jgi:hypothetical protein